MLEENRIAHFEVSTPIQRVLKVAGQYKEMIAIIVFFLGGLSWILGYFATKQQAKELHCTMQKNVDHLDSQMQLRFYQDELIDIGRDLEELGTKELSAPLSEREKQKRIHLGYTSRQISQTRDELNRKYLSARDALQKNACADH